MGEEGACRTRAPARSSWHVYRAPSKGWIRHDGPGQAIGEGLALPRVGGCFLCIEAHPEVRQKILDYFARHDYVVVGKYLRADTQNLYFPPLTPAG